MDRFVRNFIAMSLVYLAVASVLGVLMLVSPPAIIAYKFVHSHLMLLGWVSMMIYGVGYHILPRFAGRLIKHRGLAESQFWLANLGLVGMAAFYVLVQKNPGSSGYVAVLGVAGAVETISVFMFFYNMIVTVFAKDAGETGGKA